MRSPRRRHDDFAGYAARTTGGYVLVVTVLATTAGVTAQPTAPPSTGAPGPAAIGAATGDEAPPPRPASAAAAAEAAAVTASIPDWQPGPSTFAVTAFENHVVNGKSLDWIVAEAPFEIATKAENVLGLEARLAPLYVTGERVPPDPDTVNEFARRAGAQLVVTGWFDRIGENLRVAVLVWRADRSLAKVVGEAQRMGPPAQYHRILGEAAGEAWSEAGIAVDVARGERLTRALSSDTYPVFMMGRGLGHFTGALAAMEAYRALVTGQLAPAPEIPNDPTAKPGRRKAPAPLPGPSIPLPKLGVGTPPRVGGTAPRAGVPGGIGTPGTGGGSGSAGDAAGAIVPDLDAAKHDLERAVFLDPKLFEAQRLLGELYMATAAGDAKLIAKATGKFNYAADLAPDDVPSLRAAAFAMSSAGKHEVALELFRKLVGKRPWDLDARYELGAALWHGGDAHAAERQLEQVTAQRPDHLRARRVLVLIHASRNDTPRLIRELEAIETRAPLDLEIKSDLATAYGAVGEWPKAIKALERIAEQRPQDLALLVRIGDAHRRHGSLDTALQWYQRAGRVEPDSSLPGFAIAQALFDAGRLAEAQRAFTMLQKFSADRAAAVHDIGVVAFYSNVPGEAAWNLREAVKSAPRVLASRRALVAAELVRKDVTAALAQVDAALVGWPTDGALHYLAGIANSLAGDTDAAREHLTIALQRDPELSAAKAALSTINAGGKPAVDFKPELVRPWGDGEALQVVLDRYEQSAAAMAELRIKYQKDVLDLLGAVGQGPSARVKAGSVRTCPAGRIAPTWQRAQQELAEYIRLGVDLENAYRFIARHDEAALTTGLLPNARTQVASAKKRYRTALADVGELRAEWTRGVAQDLRAAGCSDKLLAAAIRDPQRYKIIQDDKPEAIPTKQPPRARARTTFFIDNTRCADQVEVWIDGAHVGQVAPGRRSALVSDGGEHALCLLLPGGAQCGDRGTVRQVYLHDGWSTTMYCPK